MAADPENEKSYGNISERHWTRSRQGQNQEALAYLRARSQAPGVREGGAARNYYCMHCDGVIPHAHTGPNCPHCQAPLEGQVKRYFNWVEIDQPTASDLRALWPWLCALAGFCALILWLLFRWIF